MTTKASVSNLVTILFLLLSIYILACQGASTSQCIESCQTSDTYNVVTYKINSVSRVSHQYCCASPQNYPVLFGAPTYVPSCVCSPNPLSTGYTLPSDHLNIYYGEYASLGGCDSTSETPCPTCCIDAAPASLWGQYSASTLLASGIERPDSILLTASWKCPGQQDAQLRTTVMSYDPSRTDSPPSTTSWYTINTSSHVEMSLIYRSDTADYTLAMQTTGPALSCSSPIMNVYGSNLFTPLQPVVYTFQLQGTWMGVSAMAQSYISQPNDCYRVSSLEFYTHGYDTDVSSMSIQVIYVKHDTITNDLFWPSQVSSMSTFVDAITGSDRVKVALPSDPDGIQHTLYITGRYDMSGLLSLHGTNSKCNAAFYTPQHTEQTTTLLPVGDVKSFALRLFAGSESGCVVDPFVNNFAASGLTGTCFSWIGGMWGVVQFTSDDVGVLTEYTDRLCQNRVLVTTNNTSNSSSFSVSSSTSSFRNVSGPVGVCSDVGEFNTYHTHALFTHAATSYEALEEINLILLALNRSSSSSSSSTAPGQEPQIQVSTDAVVPSSSSFPITRFGLIVGGCVAFLLIAFLIWCWRDINKTHTRIQPAAAAAASDDAITSIAVTLPLPNFYIATTPNKTVIAE